jgi:hypothetical protein
MEKKKSSVDFIFNAFNLLSDADFKAWMLNNHDVLKEMHKNDIEEAYNDGAEERHNNPINGEDYYKETYGGTKN